MFNNGFSQKTERSCTPPGPQLFPSHAIHSPGISQTSLSGFYHASSTNNLFAGSGSGVLFS